MDGLLKMILLSIIMTHCGIKTQNMHTGAAKSRSVCSHHLDRKRSLPLVQDLEDRTEVPRLLPDLVDVFLTDAAALQQ